MREDKNKYYIFILYIVVIFMINLVGIKVFFRVDLTSNGLYSLSQASKDAVATLKEPLTINVFFSRNLPAPYNNIEKYLHDLLEEYAIYANNFLNYRFYNVSAQEGDISSDAEENRKLAQDYGIYPVNVQKIEADEAKVQRAYMGIALVHGDITEKLPAITSTEGLEYKITSTIQKMNNKISALLNLPENVKVILVQSSSLNRIAPLINLSGLNSLKDKIDDVVRDVNKKTYGKLELATVDPQFNSEFKEKLRKYERFSLQWPDITNKDGSVIEAGQAILAIGLEYGGKSVEQQLLNKSMKLTSRGLVEEYNIIDMKNIETFITDNVDALININDDIGYLSSNETLTLSSSMPPQMQMMRQQPESLGNFNSLVNKSYSIKEVNIKDEDISEKMDTLIIAGAKGNFSDWELFQIDQFLMKGKSLAIFVESFREIQQNRGQNMYGFNQPVYLPLNTGLEKLLSHYGISVKKSYLMDKKCYINRGRLQEEMPIYFAPIIQNNKINHSLKFLENIKGLIAIKASPIELDQEKIKKNGLQSHILFSSSDESWEMTGRINLMPMMIRPPDKQEEFKSSPLAAILEGEFTSYFADKPIPKKPEKKDKEDNGEENEKAQADESKEKVAETTSSKIEEKQGVITKGRPGKIFLIGSSEILKDNVLDEEGISPNSVFLLNTLDYLNGKEDIAVMRSKNQKFNPLDDTSPFVRTLIKVINIGGLPIAVILFGIMVWIKRKTRRKKIQAMFAKSVVK